MFFTNFKKICCSFASRCQEMSTFRLSATQATVLRKKEKIEKSKMADMF